MSIAVGIVLALIVGGSSTFFGLDRDRALYPVVMIVIASYYALFAVMDGSMGVLIIESAVAAAFVSIALAGFKSTLWLVVIPSQRTASLTSSIRISTQIRACRRGGHGSVLPMILRQLLIWPGCLQAKSFGRMRPNNSWRRPPAGGGYAR